MQTSLEATHIEELYQRLRPHQTLSLEQAASLFALTMAHKTGWKNNSKKLLPKVTEQLILEASDAGLEATEQLKKKATHVLRQLPDVQVFISHASRAGVQFNTTPEQEQLTCTSPEPSTQYVERALVSGSKTWRLQDDQDRALRIIESDLGEHISIEGFAGSGKTHLTSALGEILSPKSTLLVATTLLQLNALCERLPGFQGATFASLVRDAYANIHGISAYKLPPRYLSKFTRSWEDVCIYMGFPTIKNQSPERVAYFASDLVRKFCFGSFACFDLQLFPWNLENLFPTKTDQWALIHAAEALWEATMKPPHIPSELPVRSYHIMKWLLLNRHPLTASKTTHLVFDEGHDVAPPILRLIDESELTAISLGDRFQYLGTGEPGQRADRVRPYHFQHSIRSGRNVSPIVNDVLALHPSSEGFEFIGNSERETKRIPYSRLDNETLVRVSVQRGSTAILAGKLWAVFSIVQRLASNNIPFCLLTPPSKLLSVIDGALKIYQGKAHLNYDPMTLNCKNWDDLRKQEGVIVDGLQQLFERGFKKSDLESSLKKSELNNSLAIRVGLVEEAKNREFDNVILTSDIRYGNYKNPRIRSRVLGSLYTGITRGIHTVYYQEDMLDIAIAGIKKSVSGE